MEEMELLTEKDLEYFRKKAEEGAVVILELEEEQILHWDVLNLKILEKEALKMTSTGTRL